MGGLGMQKRRLELAEQCSAGGDPGVVYLMNQHGLRICWSMDFHLGLTGVALVIHQE